jgi:hypothetical protein
MRSERGTRFFVSGFPEMGIQTVDRMEPAVETTPRNSPKTTHTATLSSQVIGAVGRLLAKIGDASAVPGIRTPQEGREP